MFTAQEIIDLWNRTETEASSFRALQKSASQYVLPHANNLMMSPKDALASQGTEKAVKLTDTTPGEANRNLAAGLYAYLFPVNEQPFTLVAVPDEANDNPQIADAMSRMTKITQFQIANSNFPLQFFSLLEYLGAKGGACMYVEKSRSKGPILSFKNINIQNVNVLYNSIGHVDTVMYRFALTPRQAAQEWIKTGMTEEVKKKILSKKLYDMLQAPDKMHTPQNFLHIVYPRNDWNPDKADVRGKPWVSQYVYEEGKHITHNGGYEENPYSVVWFWKAEEERMGRGPGTENLPEFRMTNRMRKTFIKSSEKQCDPPIFAPDDGALTPYRTDPQSMIIYRPGLNKNDFWALDTKPDVRLTFEVIKEQQELIHRKFFNHLFQPLSDYRNMTATEAIERTEQNLRLLIPPVGRLQRELLNYQIIRAVGILSRAGYFPFLEGLPDIAYRIEYQGKLALAIRELEGHALSQSITMWTPYLEINPAPLDNIDGDIGFRETMRSRGVPADWIKDPKVRDQDRQQRAKIEQTAQMLQMAESAGKAVKDLGKPTDETSPLAQLGTR